MTLSFRLGIRNQVFARIVSSQAITPSPSCCHPLFPELVISYTTATHTGGRLDWGRTLQATKTQGHENNLLHCKFLHTNNISPRAMLPSLSRRTLLPLLAFTTYTQALSNRATSMSFTTERSGGTITVSPRNKADQSGLIVISHGLGDTAEGFVDVAEVGHAIQTIIYKHVTTGMIF